MFLEVHCFQRCTSLVTSSLISESDERESANYGYKFGQEQETYNIVAAHGYFGRLIFQYASFNNSRALHFFLGLWPVVCIWLTALGVSTMAFNLNGLNFNQSIVDSQGRILNTWADILNRTNLGMEVMHERNAHNFPLDLFDCGWIYGCSAVYGCLVWLVRKEDKTPTKKMCYSWIELMIVLYRWVCVYVGFLGDPFTQTFSWAQAYFTNPGVVSGFTNFGSHLLADYGVLFLDLASVVDEFTVALPTVFENIIN